MKGTVCYQIDSIDDSCGQKKAHIGATADKGYSVASAASRRSIGPSASGEACPAQALATVDQVRNRSRIYLEINRFEKRRQEFHNVETPAGE
ncbi:MAG: hypothetical protein RIM72_13295 [Alphaproteobacteria bacterium]